MLKIYFLRVLFRVGREISRYFSYIFVTLRVAEATVRVSLLTILIRTHGRDFLKIFISPKLDFFIASTKLLADYLIRAP